MNKIRGMLGSNRRELELDSFLQVFQEALACQLHQFACHNFSRQNIVAVGSGGFEGIRNFSNGLYRFNGRHFFNLFRERRTCFEDVEDFLRGDPILQEMCLDVLQQQRGITLREDSLRIEGGRVLIPDATLARRHAAWPLRHAKFKRRGHLHLNAAGLLLLREMDPPTCLLQLFNCFAS